MRSTASKVRRSISALRGAEGPTLDPMSRFIHHPPVSFCLFVLRLYPARNLGIRSGNGVEGSVFSLSHRVLPRAVGRFKLLIGIEASSSFITRSSLSPGSPLSLLPSTPSC